MSGKHRGNYWIHPEVDNVIVRSAAPNEDKQLGDEGFVRILSDDARYRIVELDAKCLAFVHVAAISRVLFAPKVAR